MTVHAYRQGDPAGNPLCGATDATRAMEWRGVVLAREVDCRQCRWIAGGGTGPAPTHGTGYDADLAVRFTYHLPEPEQPEVYQVVRDLGHLFALLIEATTASSREQSLALTHVEEAVMWANASIARRGLSAAGIAGATDLIESAFQALLAAKPEGRLAGALSDTSPPDLATDEGDAAEEGPRTTEDPTGPHPDHWSTVCPFCPAYICTEGHGAQRDAQEWVLDHAQEAHQKDLRA